MAMISTEMANDVTLLADDIRLERWTPIVTTPEFALPGAQGVSSDASALLCLDYDALPLELWPVGRGLLLHDS